MKKFLTISLITVVSLVMIVYGGVFLGHTVFFKEERSDVPTVDAVTDGTYLFGPQAHPFHATTLESFIPVLAEQLKRYNEIAPTLWPNNTLTHQTLIVEDIQKKKLWLINPEGTFAPLSKAEAENYHITRSTFADGFSFFDGGMYYAAHEKDVANYLSWQNYYHLGTYDPIIWLVHEGFHQMQSDWPSPKDPLNQERDEFLNDMPARLQRALLETQLFEAVRDPGNTTLILDALATYQEWKRQFPDDYANSVNTDRIEGTAYYYEIVSSLYIGYPDQIRKQEDVDRAFTLLATREDAYSGYGLTREGYTVGGFSSVLLDRCDPDWKQQLMKDPDATPIEMLYQHFAHETLPEPVHLNGSQIDEYTEKIQASTRIEAMPGVFAMLYDWLF